MNQLESSSCSRRCSAPVRYRLTPPVLALPQGYSGYIPANESIPYSVKYETRRLVPSHSMQRDVNRPVRCCFLLRLSFPSQLAA
jgi:hypothetical protein